MRFINDFNLKKQADDLGVKTWQTPGGLFIAMGLVNIIIMAITYFISQNYDSPQILIIAECSVVTVVLIVGTLVTRMIEQMIKVNKMKSEFVSVASHQLRTPLSAMRWETELLLTKFSQGLNQRQLKSLSNVAALSDRMTKLVNDLLEVARIDQQGLILKKQHFDFKEIIQNILEEIMSLVKSRRIELTVDFEKRLPLAFGDPEKIKIVAENLISNAIKYNTSGGKVEIKIFKRGNYLVFEIKDNGVGVPEEQHARIFDKFFRSDNAVKYQTEGTGLGLFISKNIIEQLGGRIWFQSIENVGSVFSFSLPYDKKLNR